MPHRTKLWARLKLAAVTVGFTIALGGVSLASIAAIEPHVVPFVAPSVSAPASSHAPAVPSSAARARPPHKATTKPRAAARRRPARVSRARRAALALQFRWPVRKARVTQRFGRLGPGRFHHGIDIACTEPEPVRASKAGVVILAGMNPFYGNVVVIAHPGGWSTLYGHMSRLRVHAGRRVKIGQRLGTCGSTGVSTGPHVHFEIRRLGHFYDPWLFIVH